MAGGEPDGFVFVLSGLKAIRIVGDEVGQIGVELHVEIEDSTVTRKGVELGGDGIPEHCETREFFSICPPRLDFRH